ncbi:MAG: hypothetical protein IJC17_02305 [Clostridia bacterium]|nr:hypothetical protein [Clostridia bacterium]
MITAAISLSEQNLITIAVLTVVLIGLYLFNRYGKTESDHRADRLERQYKEMTPELLASVPDAELAEAVVANAFAKLDKQRPNVYAELPKMSPGRCAVVSTWLVDRELDSADFETLFASSAGALAELAADGMERLGAPRSAAAVRAALVAESEEQRAETHADYVEAREAENLSQKMIDYIREFTGEFLDNQEA